MDDTWAKFEQLVSAAVAELKQAQRFFIIGTDEAIEKSQQHVRNADSLIKQANEELPFSYEDAESDLPST
jgi:hypothetical protein